MDHLREYLPTDDDVLQLEPEELGGFVLEYFARDADTNDQPEAHLNRNNFGGELRQTHRYSERAVFAFMEAWEWLVREGLFVERDHGWYFVSRRGLRLRGRQGLATYRHSNLLPKGSLHPVIAERVWSAFLRGEYDTAVFQAFKEVEVAVRTGGRFLPTDIGKDLMVKAFNPTAGILTDTGAPESERQALQLLFMGAIGVFKNPSSHRHVALSDPREAAEIISFASLLMRIVDSRAPTSAA